MTSDMSVMSVFTILTRNVMVSCALQLNEIIAQSFSIIVLKQGEVDKEVQ